MSSLSCPLNLMCSIVLPYSNLCTGMGGFLCWKVSTSPTHPRGNLKGHNLWWGIEKNVCYTWLGPFWIRLCNFLKFTEDHVSRCCLITLVELFFLIGSNAPFLAAENEASFFPFTNHQLLELQQAKSCYQWNLCSANEWQKKRYHEIQLEMEIYSWYTSHSWWSLHEIMVFWINLLDLFEISFKINSHNDIRVVLSVRDRSIAQFLKSMPFSGFWCV